MTEQQGGPGIANPGSLNLSAYSPACSPPIRLSVIVPAHNCPQQLARCLRALEQSQEKSFQLIVVDDASTDQTAAEAEALGALVIRLKSQSGPAAARNAGAVKSLGEFLLFIDADVLVRPDTISTVLKEFEQSPETAAIFGSYDTTPAAGNLVSQYRNLFHHYVHQRAREEASTFWAGCGAVRREVFFEVGGFDESFRRPCIEDIEFGVRLRRGDHRIRIVKGLQVTHLKRWKLWRMLRADVRDRGIPWTSLILREKSLPDDLNLHVSQRLCGALSLFILVTFLIGVWRFPVLGLLPLLAASFVLAIDAWSENRRVPDWVRWMSLLALLCTCVGMSYLMPVESTLLLIACAVILAINIGFYRFFARERHPLFAAWVFPLHVLYYLYSVGAFTCTLAAHAISRPIASNTGGPPQKRVS
jgi:glycosyltransferase involved in cell wall biosynthesis